MMANRKNLKVLPAGLEAVPGQRRPEARVVFFCGVAQQVLIEFVWFLLDLINRLQPVKMCLMCFISNDFLLELGFY